MRQRVSLSLRSTPISACRPAPRRAPRRSGSIFSKRPESRNRLPTQSIAAARSEFEQRGATARQSSTSEQLRRRNQPKQNRDFHPTLVRLTRSAVRRYISARKKGGLNFLSINSPAKLV